MMQLDEKDYELSFFAEMEAEEEQDFLDDWDEAIYYNEVLDAMIRRFDRERNGM